MTFVTLNFAEVCYFFVCLLLFFLLGAHFFETETLVLRDAFKWPYFHNRLI